MLTQIHISDYTIVKELEMDFSQGMTVITGETGAGKSIMLDALGLCLGDRADTAAVRTGSQRAEISAVFAVAGIPAAQAWLRDRDLYTGEELLLRRVITAEGRSRAYINGTVSTLQDCAALGALLVDIHSQHAHQSLLRKPHQRELLDAYAGHLPLVREVEQCASEWLRRHKELELLAGARDERTARMQLLSYQVEELDTLSLQDQELAALEREEKLLANAHDVLGSAHAALELCEEQETGVRRALQLLSDDAHASREAADAREMLDSAAIQISEASAQIQRHLDAVEVDPEKLAEVQRRLESIYDVARKHRVMPEQLMERHLALREELDGLESGGRRVDELRQGLSTLADQYATASAKLSQQRSRAARKLEKKVADVLSTLAMDQCQLEIGLPALKSQHPHPQGREEVDIRISTNPGAPPRPLGKIASGGELSRISLAIQVVTASSTTVPSMVFDEVDVGIGGAVAEVVGKLLRSLAAQAQVLCVTHLPQVAAQGHAHLRVAKSTADKVVETRLSRLQDEERIEEIARMLGGLKITQQTLAHAREMLTG